MPRAALDLERLGFTVHRYSARRAAVRFPVGPSVELYALAPPPAPVLAALRLRYGPAAADRLAHWAVSGTEVVVEVDAGPVDGREVEGRDVVRLLAASALDPSRPVRFRRRSPFGPTVSVEVVCPRSVGLPIVITTPRTAPGQEHAGCTGLSSAEHANGAWGVVEVRVEVAPEERRGWSVLTAGDRTLTVVDRPRGPRPGSPVRSIEVAGLVADLDPRLLRGLPLVPA